MDMTHTLTRNDLQGSQFLGYQISGTPKNGDRNPKLEALSTLGLRMESATASGLEMAVKVYILGKL